MAAGEGRRLRPLTERYAKPVLPIDGRPVIVTLLHELRASGFERVTVVAGHLAEQVARLLDGFPPELRFVASPSRSARRTPSGAGRGAAGAGRRGRHRVHAGRRGAVRGGRGRRDRRPARPAAVASAPLRARRRGRPRHAVLDDDPANPLASAPLWRLGESFDQRSSSSAARRSSSQAFQRAVDAGRRPRRRDRPDPGLDASA